MGDNDLVRRGDVKAKKVYCDERHEYVVPVAEIDWLRPAIPQEMSARELLLTEARMIYADEYAYAEYSRLIWNLKLDDAAAYAERWAKEHPEERSEQ